MSEKTGTVVGCCKAAIWPITDDGTSKYGEVKDFSEKIIAVGYNLGIVSADLSAGDKVVEEYNAKTGADGDINITYLTADERVALYGEKSENGTNIEKTTDVFPYNVFAYATTRSDGKLNLYKIVKAMFKPESEKAETIKKGGIDFQTVNVKYSAIADENNTIRYSRLAVDPTTNKDVVDKWFTDAEYYVPATDQQATDQQATE